MRTTVAMTRTPKRILLITTNFYPEKTGIGVVATNFSKMLREIGCEVDVLTAMPYYPEWEIHKDYRGKVFYTEIINSVKVRRVWLYVPKKVNTLRRLFHEASFAFFVFFRALFIPCEVILFISPPLSAAPTCVALSFIKRCALWTYIQDVQPDAAIALGMLRNKFMIGLSKVLESLMYNNSKKILVLSEAMKRNINGKGVPVDKLHIIPNATMINEFKVSFTDPKQSVFRIELGLADKFLAVYSGNIGVKQNPLILIEAAKILKPHSDIFIAVVGDGALRKEMQDKIAQYNLSNIKVFPLRPEELMGDMLVSADVLLAPQREEVVDFVMPSKLLSYLASKTPVIASANKFSDLAIVLSENNAGMVCEPNDPQLLANCILELKNRPELAKSLAESGQKYLADNFSKETIISKYIKPIFTEQDQAAGQA